MHHLRLTVATALAATLVLAGCGGGDQASPSVEESSKSPMDVASEVALAEFWPLTGLPVQDGGTITDHPIYVVKIDNTSPARPQVGLSKADLLVEELVEGGSTRLAAFFYSELPKEVGPVRSMRASDIGIVKPVSAEMVTSGAAGRTYRRLKQAGITWHEEGAKGFYRNRDRRSPYNLFASLVSLAEGAKGGETRPADYLVWGNAADLPRGETATSLAAKFSGSHTTRWTFDSGAYTRDRSLAASADQFKADNVLVLRTELGDAGYKDPAGNPVPETKFEGSGEAVLFHNGKAIKATWKKKSVGDQLRLSTGAGELRVPAGHTAIELVPTRSGSLSFQ